MSDGERKDITMQIAVENRIRELQEEQDGSEYKFGQGFLKIVLPGVIRPAISDKEIIIFGLSNPQILDKHTLLWRTFL